MSRNHLIITSHYETLPIDGFSVARGFSVSRRTQKAIVDAFNRLISHKGFDEITVADIISEADVSKATFYRYFHDKYDAMNGNYKELLDEFMSLDECSS